MALLFRTLGPDLGDHAAVEKLRASALRASLTQCVLEAVSAYAALQPWLSALEQTGDDVTNAAAAAAVADLEAHVDALGRVSRSLAHAHASFSPQLVSAVLADDDACVRGLEAVYSRQVEAIIRALDGVEQIVVFRLMRDDDPALVAAAQRLVQLHASFGAGERLPWGAGSDADRGGLGRSGRADVSADDAPARPRLHAHEVAVRVAVAAAVSRTAAADLCLCPTTVSAADAAEDIGAFDLGPRRPLGRELVAAVARLGEELSPLSQCGPTKSAVVRLGHPASVALRSAVPPPARPQSSSRAVGVGSLPIGEYFERRFEEELAHRLALDTSWLFRSLSLGPPEAGATFAPSASSVAAGAAESVEANAAPGIAAHQTQVALARVEALVGQRQRTLEKAVEQLLRGFVVGHRPPQAPADAEAAAVDEARAAAGAVEAICVDATDILSVVERAIDHQGGAAATTLSPVLVSRVEGVVAQLSSCASRMAHGTTHAKATIRSLSSLCALCVELSRVAAVVRRLQSRAGDSSAPAVTDAVPRTDARTPAVAQLDEAAASLHMACAGAFERFVELVELVTRSLVADAGPARVYGGGRAMGTGADAPTPSALAQTLRAQLLAPIASVFLAKQATALDCETESMREILHALVRCALDTIADEVLEVFEAPSSSRAASPLFTVRGALAFHADLLHLKDW